MKDRIPGALGVNDFCEWAGLGRTKVYEEIAAGRLPVFKVGRRTLITMNSAQGWLHRASGCAVKSVAEPADPASVRTRGRRGQGANAIVAG
ncbi:hypothetical protein AB7M35_001699 [Amorphus suaedae]